MRRTISALALLGACGLTASVSASDPTFQFAFTQNFFSLRQDGLNPEPPDTFRPPNPFYVGLPASIETNGSSNVWFIGGIAENPQWQPWRVAVVKVEFPDNTGVGRQFRTMPSTRQGIVTNANIPTPDPNVGPGPGASSARGWHSLRYAERKNPGGLDRLIMGGDSQISNSIVARMYDVGTQLNPILLATTPTSILASDARLGGGAAFDFGPDPANNNAASPPFDGLDGEAIPSVLHFGDVGPRTLRTVGGIMDFRDGSIIDKMYTWFGRVDGAGELLTEALPYSPSLFPHTYLGDGVTPNTASTANSLHRQYEYHPTNGMILARANNLLRIVGRNPNGTTVAGATNSTAEKRVVITPPGGQGDFVVLQNLRILHGGLSGDFVVWNDRPAGAPRPFTQGVVMNRITSFDAPTPFPFVTPQWKNADGSTFTGPNVDPIFDFAWIRDEKRLIVLASVDNNGTAYVFDLVEVAPSVVESPSNENVSEGATVQLNVVATGDAIRYEWRKDNAPLSNGGSISGATTATLTITGVLASDAGNYSVRVFNALGEDISAAAALVVGGGSVACNPADIAQTDSSPGPDGCVDNGDFGLFISAFFSASCGSTCGELPVTQCNPADIAQTDSSEGFDGCVDNGDFGLFISSFFSAFCPDCGN